MTTSMNQSTTYTINYLYLIINQINKLKKYTLGPRYWNSGVGQYVLLATMQCCHIQPYEYPRIGQYWDNIRCSSIVRYRNIPVYGT